MARDDVLIIGAGIIGCSLALRLADERLSVTLVERGEPGQQASWAAAGMIAPTAEDVHGPAEAELAQASAALYPEWLRRLKQRTGIDTGYRTEGTLLVAFNADEAAHLHKVPGDKLTREEVCRREPSLSDRIEAALYLPNDRQVDNRRLLEALLQTASSAGVRLLTKTTVTQLVVESDRVIGVRTAEGSTLAAGTVVDAAGCWAGELEAGGLPRLPIRPIRGQMVSLRGGADALRHVIRSPRAYVVPRAEPGQAGAGGRLLIGSTMEDVGYDKSVTPVGLRRLLSGAAEIAPGIAALPFEAAWAGLRPDTPDHLPILGATEIENYFVATGHFRNGILLAPITAQLLTDAILGRRPTLPLEPFSPSRFGNRGDR